MPANSFWALTKLEYYYSETGVIVVATTDHPVHLYFRWTYETIRKHQAPYIQRGTSVSTVPRICFTVFSDNEQIEPGDTLIHTFIKEPWPVCSTRQFYFWAMIEGWVAISETAIFTFHKVPAGEWHTFDSLPQDGYIEVHKDTYAEARAAASGPVYSAGTTIRTGQWKSGGDFYMARSGLYFDTSAIPPDMWLLSAQLVLQGEGFASFNDAQCLRVVSDEDLSPAGLVGTDYGQLQGRTVNHGELCVEAGGAGWDSWGPNTLWLMPLGINRINKGGISKFALRGTHDILNIPDTLFIENNRFSWHSYDIGEALRPKLRVLYAKIEE